jgi:hypothetical protein
MRASTFDCLLPSASAASAATTTPKSTTSARPAAVESRTVRKPPAVQSTESPAVTATDVSTWSEPVGGASGRNALTYPVTYTTIALTEAVADSLPRITRPDATRTTDPVSLACFVYSTGKI